MLQTTTNFAYLPFGGGKRKCIGDQFALFESVVALSMLQRRFTFELDPEAPPVAMTTGATIHTTEGLNVKLRVRAHADSSVWSEDDVPMDGPVARSPSVHNGVTPKVHNGASMCPMHAQAAPKDERTESDAVSKTGA
jgi:hypothetical protein